MSTVRLEFPLESGLKGVPSTQLITVRSLSLAELERLQDADLDTLVGAYTGLSTEQVARLTPNDRAAIIAARRSMT